MDLLATLTGIALLATIVVATGVLCYAALTALARLETAAVASSPARTSRDPDRRN